MAVAHITPELFTFLRALARNNNRDWFARNKSRYEEQVRDPLCAFVEAIGPKLKALSPAVIADSRPVGGSLFRIYRDTRFSKDKTPYKTQAAVWFRTATKDIVAPSFYLHVAPGDVFCGVGVYHVPTEGVRAVRDAIVDHPEQWKKVRRVGLSGDPELKRPPRGFDPDHPFIDDLRRKNFVTTVSFSEQEACAKDFATRFTRACRKGMPLAKFLASALDTSI